MGLPASNTPRVYLDYTVGGEQHTLIARYPESGTKEAAIDTMVELFAFLDAALFTVTIDGARWSAINSDITNPLAWPGDPTYGASSPSAGQEMKFFSIVGKSSGGNRVRYMLFGLSQAIPTTWRLATGVNAQMDDALDHIQAAHTAGTWCTIAGTGALLKRYFNAKYADHEIQKKRG